jgi:hypothetical protein
MESKKANQMFFKCLIVICWFYVIVIIATVLGMALNFTPINPIKALFWSAVINGVISCAKGKIIADLA